MQTHRYYYEIDNAPSSFERTEPSNAQSFNKLKKDANKKK